MTTTTENTTAKYKIKGIISAERPCECCGNRNLEKNVVLENIDSGELLYVGTTCAGYLLLGKKTRKNAQLIEKEARAHEYAEKWIGIYGDSEEILQKIASKIRCHYCPATVYKGKLLIGSEMTA